MKRRNTTPKFIARKTVLFTVIGCVVLGLASLLVGLQMHRDSLLEASEFVHMVENRQGIQISAPEEIAFIRGWINRDELMESAKLYGKSPYGEHLKAVAEGKIQY